MSTGRLGAALVGLVAVLVGGTGVAVVATHAAPATAVPAAAVQAARAATAPDPVQVPVPDPAEVPVPGAGTSAPAAAPDPAASAAPPAVRPLSGLAAPDARVRVPVDVDAAAVAALRGVTAVAVLDLVAVPVAGRDVVLAGVDPSQVRGFTPQATAASDALWAAVGRGELVASYGLQRDRGLQLGAALPQGRLGAVAALGLDGVDLLADRATAARAGTVAQRSVLVAAPDRALPALRRDLRRLLGEVEVEVLRPEPVRAVPVGRAGSYRELYQASARLCPGLSWTVLAAVGQVESGHGRDLGPSSAGALGPMQFLPSTWAAYGVDGDGDGEADIMSPHDAVPAAALYLCRFGGGRDAQGLYDALYAYNHADWYVRKVLGIAAQYR